MIKLHAEKNDGRLDTIEEKIIAFEDISIETTQKLNAPRKT